MIVSIVIATCGEGGWEELAWTQAYPSTLGQGAREVIMEHLFDATIEEARNEAAAQAVGDWLCFLDADDQLAPDYIRAMRWAEVCGVTPALLIPAVSYVTADGEASVPEVPNTGYSFTVMNHAVIGSLVPRDLFMEVGGFSEGFGPYEDWHLFRKCHAAGAELVYAPGAVYRAFVHEDSRHRGASQLVKVRAYQAIQRDLRRFAREQARPLQRGARSTSTGMS